MEGLLALIAAAALAGDGGAERRVEQRIERSLTAEFVDVVVRDIGARRTVVSIHTVLRPDVDRARRVSVALCWVLRDPIPGVRAIRVLSHEDRLLRRCARR